MIYHNSFYKKYRTPFGAIQKKSEIFLSIYTDENIDKCYIRFWNPDKKEEIFPMEKKLNSFIFKGFLDKIGVYWYYFILQSKETRKFYCCKETFTNGEGYLCDNPKYSFQITVYDNNLKVPDWFKCKNTMYQIFPDSFARKGLNVIDDEKRDMHINWNDTPKFNNKGSDCTDFYGGNFQGIIDKLDYLENLNIKTLYFNPIFESSTNHRYDTGDYEKIDHLLGDEDVLKKLICECKKRNMYIIIDGVFNHTGCDSKYFNKFNNYTSLGAYQSKDSTYYKWYKFYKHPDNYSCWWGFENLPCVNKEEESYKNYIYNSSKSILNKWISMGIYGWRIDVPDELSDEFLKEFKSKMKQLNPESVLIGEVWEDATNKRSYDTLREYTLGYEFDSIMNYPLRKLLLDFICYGYQEDEVIHENIDAEVFNNRILNLYCNYPKDIFYSLMNFLSTHDTSRIMNILSECPKGSSLTKDEQSKYRPLDNQIEIGIKRLKLCYAFLCFFPGVPCIYYGDEIGMFGYRDPFNRKSFPWKKINTNILKFFKHMNNLKKSSEILDKGNFIPIYYKDDVYAFKREYKNNSYIFILNRNKNCGKNITLNVKEKYINFESNKKCDLDNIYIPELRYQILKSN